MEKYEPIIQFFKSIGSEHEANMYLRLFKRGDPARFAVIHVDYRVLDSIPVSGVDLAYLSNLDLYPIVIHDSGEKDSRPVTKRSRSLKKILSANKNIVEAVSGQGGRCLGLTDGVFKLVEGPGPYAIQVDPKPLRDAIKHDAIPIVAPLARMPSGQTLLLDAAEAAKALVLTFQPKKYVLMNREGGIMGRHGKLVSLITVSSELRFTPSLSSLERRGASLAKKIGHLLTMNGEGLMAEVTSPQNFLRELFTIKGGGTLLKMGSEISHFTNYADVNKKNLRRLLEACFRKRLKPGFFSTPIDMLWLEKSYKGAAIVRQVNDLRINDLYYLDKFAVKTESQGEGTGADLWEHILAMCPRIFWRSRPQNPVNDWYYERCSGMQKLDHWYVWWINVPEESKSQILRYAQELPGSFEEAGGSTS